MAYQNTGNEGWKVILEKNPVTMALTGRKMPNLPQISPQAIVLSGAAITYNYPTDVAPTGGANGDIWYNPVADNLYKKISGAWTLLTDRVTNDYYIAPVLNTGACALPA